MSKIRSLKLSLSISGLLAMSFLLMPSAQAETFNAKVVSVIDGDTISVLHDGSKERVILYGIDCPEMAQEFGPEAKTFTDEACYGKTVGIEFHGRDPKGRTIGTVILSDGTNLNKQLVEKGLAWWSDKFAPKETRLQVLQASARSAKTGLWSAPNPIPPWLFRNGDKGVSAQVISK